MKFLQFVFVTIILLNTLHSLNGIPHNIISNGDDDKNLIRNLRETGNEVTSTTTSTTTNATTTVTTPTSSETTTRSTTTSTTAKPDSWWDIFLANLKMFFGSL
uniref:Uncharacterized protein n=1 Tax=Strongyloides stercoralis TaxID=6248 RepID=A0A0K0EBH9_STRER